MNVDNAIRNLWDIRNLCWNCHRSVSGVVLLAFGRRDKRSPHLEQHYSSRSQVKGNANTPRGIPRMGGNR
jgi:5-methylcytosine-specific restriction endonuclease McrA